MALPWTFTFETGWWKEKNAEEIKAALRTEFKPGHCDREFGLEKLSNQDIAQDESVHRFIELAKLAYPTSPTKSIDAIAKAYLIKGQSKHMQVVLKSLTDSSAKKVTDLAKEAVWFQTVDVPLLNAFMSNGLEWNIPIVLFHHFVSRNIQFLVTVIFLWRWRSKEISVCPTTTSIRDIGSKLCKLSYHFSIDILTLVAMDINWTSNLRQRLTRYFGRP